MQGFWKYATQAAGGWELIPGGPSVQHVAMQTHHMEPGRKLLPSQCSLIPSDYIQLKWQLVLMCLELFITQNSLNYISLFYRK